MKILIAGNMGYIGPVVGQYFRSRYEDLQLVGFDPGFFAGCLADPREFPERIYDRQVFGDVRETPKEVVEGVDVVIYLAAVSNDPMGKEFEEATHAINARAAAAVARTAKESGVHHFVFASSCSVYGFAEEGAKTEESELNPLTAYARSKIEGEKLLEPLAGPDFRVTCLRFGTACGWSPRIRLDLVLNDFLACALALGKIEILSDGTPWRPLIHVRDMARAMDWASHRETDNEKAFLTANIGSDQWNFQVRDLALAVQKVDPSTEVFINENASPDGRSYRVDFERFRTLAPDYQPAETLEEAISEIHRNLSDLGFRDEAFRQSNYIRLKVLKDLVDRRGLQRNLVYA